MARRPSDGLGRGKAADVYEELLSQGTSSNQNPSRGTAMAGSLAANYAADFGPYYVSRANEYYQGPARSTRVKAHQFVPSDKRVQELIEAGSDWYLSNQLYWAIPGFIYVRFHKYGTLWKYGPCTLQDYRFFREYYSKGRYVRDLERYGHGRANEGDSGVKI